MGGRKPGLQLSAAPLAMGVLLATVLAGRLVGDGVSLSGAWLDTQTLTNWNTAGNDLPKSQAGEGESLVERCADQVLEPAGREDRAVADAGWSVVAEPQARSGAVVVTAATGADGMCRPLGVQAFVFVEGKFAGTLSPHTMDSRTDGILGRVQLFGATLRADFRRYAASDPLCCPSRTSTVSYKLQTTPGGPLLVPNGVETVRNPPTRR
jgi:hypothetical protein